MTSTNTLLTDRDILLKVIKALPFLERYTPIDMPAFDAELDKDKYYRCEDYIVQLHQQSIWVFASQWLLVAWTDAIDDALAIMETWKTKEDFLTFTGAHEAIKKALIDD